VPDRGELLIEFTLEDTAFCKAFRQIFTASLARRSDTGANYVAVCVWEGRVFYEYYQIDRDDEDDETDEFESGSEKESRSESSHSLFGLIYSLQKETGWTHDYILWGESWFNLQMKLADVPRTIKIKRKKEITTDEELEEFLMD